ncbi:deoxyguanosinetriphosphate triphosphohydrolase family protein [Neiella marina]|uniref:Deoxyguanosinetriphosphate triphosphohydrolase-like protein n=1 Tax=Neiella holothuriorum TaxID=2870530 RepID=A0ABS7ECP5_9GAMM|nr:anti-phage deoxyguanosine triphosphatase [Neiella holothuriorum]MBW8190097.1 deoxyguanosinetriphosphate triphosphohydrolase family protein [Neiella holothuriorum]
MTDAWQDRRSEENKARRDDHRSPFQRDRARVLHSAAFRRLQAKTQIHGVGSSDFYRTRLTHSLEASQIGSGIHAQLKLKYPDLADLLGPVELIETLCLAHDLGHPPFGHGGEVALHYMMRHHGGFEGNGQTFRIVTTLEPYTEFFGMNLARRSLLGLVKYPVLMGDVSKLNPDAQTNIRNARELKSAHWHPAKALYDCDQRWFDWLLAPLTSYQRTNFTKSQDKDEGHRKAQFKSLDCSIMELADDIAYGIHDLEDAITLNMVRRDQWVKAELALMEVDDPWINENVMSISEQLFSRFPYIRKNAIGALVNYFITTIEISRNQDFDEPLLSYNATLPSTALQALKIFKKFVFDHVIQSHQVQTAEYKGQQMIMAIFEAYASDPARLLPADAKERWRQQSTDSSRMRVIADWVSSLTDQSAVRIHKELFA